MIDVFKTLTRNSINLKKVSSGVRVTISAVSFVFRAKIQDSCMHETAFVSVPHM